MRAAFGLPFQSVANFCAVTCNGNVANQAVAADHFKAQSTRLGKESRVTHALECLWPTVSVPIVRGLIRAELRAIPANSLEMLSTPKAPMLLAGGMLLL